MYTLRETASFWSVGLYAWMASIVFGAVLLDTVYASQVTGGNAGFGEAVDSLLQLSSATMLAGLVSILLPWQVRAARVYVITSLAVLALEFLGPGLFAPSVGEMQGAGAGLRIAIHALASVLAFIGLGKTCLRRIPENN